MASDQIRMSGLELRTRIGISASERAKPQKVLCSLQISADCSRAARTDDIADTINAQEVAAAVRALAASRPRHLLERLAEEIAQCILSEFPAESVTVTLEKFVLPRANSYGVRVERRR